MMFVLAFALPYGLLGLGLKERGFGEAYGEGRTRFNFSSDFFFTSLIKSEILIRRLFNVVNVLLHINYWNSLFFFLCSPVTVDMSEFSEMFLSYFHFLFSFRREKQRRL